MTPTKIILERTSTHVQLRVIMTGTLKGYTVLSAVPFRTGDCIPGMRKQAAKYAKRFAIPFVDSIGC